MALPTSLSKLPLLVLPVDESVVARTIGKLAWQVMQAVDKGVEANILRTIGNTLETDVPDSYVAPSLADENWVVEPSKGRHSLPLIVQVWLPGPAQMYVQFAFHERATLATLCHAPNHNANPTVILREALNNEEPDDFYGLISLMLTIWRKASDARPYFRVRKRVAFFDQNTQKGYHFSIGDPVECTLDLLRIRKRSDTPGESHPWYVLGPEDRTSSVPRAVRERDLEVVPSPHYADLRQALDSYIKDGHTGPLDFLDSVFGTTSTVIPASMVASTQSSSRPPVGKSIVKSSTEGKPLGDPFDEAEAKIGKILDLAQEIRGDLQSIGNLLQDTKHLIRDFSLKDEK